MPLPELTTVDEGLTVPLVPVPTIVTVLIVKVAVQVKTAFCVAPVIATVVVVAAPEQPVAVPVPLVKPPLHPVTR